MFSMNWLPWRRHSHLKHASRRRPLAKRASRLLLEQLEDRAVPATFTVTTRADVVDPADGKLSLREAITRANQRPGNDTIVLKRGVYRIALAGSGDDGNVSGDFDITDSVVIRGAGAGVTSVDGQRLDRVFDVAGTSPSSIRVVFDDLAVRNGDVASSGGGILYGDAVVVVRDSIIAGNRSSLAGAGLSNGLATGTGNATIIRSTISRNVSGGAGGGIFVGASHLTLKSSTVRLNVAVVSGGGISATTATLTGSTIAGNAGLAGGGLSVNSATLTNTTVTGNNAASGGGIFAAATVTLVRSAVSANNASGGDGGGVRAGTATLNNTTIAGNRAAGAGGGLFASTATLVQSTVNANFANTSGGGVSASGTATLVRSTLSNNATGGAGGGLEAATANLTNSTVSGNAAAGDGGGIFATAANLLNVTVVENIAQNDGGGVFHDPGGTFTIRNTIIALNLVAFSGSGPDAFGVFASAGHNLVGISSFAIGLTDGLGGDQIGTSTNPIDPRLGPLQNNGGPTRTHALLAGSRAIDRGDNSGVPGTDQRGRKFPRRKDGNGDGSRIVDIGAFER